MTDQPNKKRASHRQAGFTLMEMMIYIALFGIIITGAVVGTYNLLEGSDRNIKATGIQEEGTFLNRKISWALSDATAVSVSGGGKTLTITRPDLGTQSPLVISGTGIIINITRGSGIAINLNSDRFQVTNINFIYTPSANGRPPSVQTTFQINGKSFNFRRYLR